MEKFIRLHWHRKVKWCLMAVLLLVCVGSSAQVSSEERLSFECRNESLALAFQRLERASGYKILFTYEDVQAYYATVSVRDKSVREIMDALIGGHPLTYTMEGRYITVTPDGKRDAKGQRRVLRGTVTDSRGEPLIGVSVRIPGTRQGTVTDVDGRFTLPMPADRSHIELSYIGMKPQRLSVKGREQITAVMEEDSQMLDDFVVTGYQTISKERATGAFDIMDRSKLESSIHTDALSALEGEVPGLSTYNDKIIIRGVSTFSSSVGNDPLIVIDGMPTEQSLADININDIESITVLKDAAASSIYGVRAANGVISVVTTRQVKDRTDIRFTADWKWEQNPSLSDYHLASTSDIIDFELQHISSSALRTNQTEAYMLKDQLKGIGEAGRTSSTLNYYSPLRYARYQYTNGLMSEADYNALVNGWRALDYRREYMDLAWRTPLRQSYNLSVNSGTDRQSTYVSLNYTGDAQRVISNENRSFKGYIKTTQKLTDWLSFDLGVDAQFERRTSGDSNYTSFTTLEPYTQIQDAEGNRVYRDYVDLSNQTFMGGLHINQKILDQIEGLPQFMPYTFNILDELEDNLTRQENFYIRSFAKLNFDIMEGLRFTTSFSYEYAKDNSETYNSADSYYIRFLRNRFATYAPVNSVIPEGGRMSMTDTSQDNWTFRNQLDYNTTIKDDHAINLSAGLELRQNKVGIPNTSTYYGYDPVSLAYTTLDVNTLRTIGTRESYIYNNNTSADAVRDGSYNRLLDLSLAPSLSSLENRYFSGYFVGGYTYKDRYGISGSFRIDQANLFGTDPKYRYRPLWSVGFKWNMAKEDFMKSLTWIDVLDLRGSYGLTGNVDQTTTPYLVANMYTQNRWTAETIPYTSISTAPNPMLRWERTASWNVGVDFILLDGKLNGKMDYYYKKSDDLLATIEVPFTSGYSSQRVNYGAMTNHGFEMSLTSPWFRNRDWSLETSFSFYYNKNKVTRSFYNATQASHLISGAYMQQGRPFAALYAYRYDGLTSGGTDEQNGIPQILRADGSEVVTFNDDGTVNIAPSSTMKPEDLVYMGSRTPVWGGSFTQRIRFRDWELSAFVVYYGGHKVYVPSFDFYNSSYNTLSDFYADSWTPENPDSEIPKHYFLYDKTANASYVIGLQEMYQKSTANVKRGDLIRLRNVSLSYTLPARYAQKVRMENIRLTAQVNNPCFWSAAGKGIDPETLGTDGSWTLPEPTSYLLKLNVQF